MLTLFALLVDVVGLIVSGFCGMVLWNWYMPLVFTDIPRLNYVAAIGLGLVVATFSTSGTTFNLEDFEDESGPLKAVLNGIIKDIGKPIGLLIAGGIIYFFV